MKSSGGLIDPYRRPHTKHAASIKGTSREPGSDECVECVCVCICGFVCTYCKFVKKVSLWSMSMGVCDCVCGRCSVARY